MLAVATLAQLALAEFPPLFETVAHTAGAAAWRRWLAQQCREATLNRVPDGRLIRQIIQHMLADACELYPDAPQSIDALKEFLPPEEWADPDTEQFLEQVTAALQPGQVLRVRIPQPYDENERITALLLASVDAMPVVPNESNEDENLAALLLTTFH